jgi:signal transduction histidine kinase
VTITVTDNGIGITPEHQRRIFDPFFTTRLGRGGSGLGLNIVHNLVTDVLGGTIDVDSDPDAGTAFTMVLPLVAPRPVAKRAPAV